MQRASYRGQTQAFGVSKTGMELLEQVAAIDEHSIDRWKAGKRTLS